MAQKLRLHPLFLLETNAYLSIAITSHLLGEFSSKARQWPKNWAYTSCPHSEQISNCPDPLFLTNLENLAQKLGNLGNLAKNLAQKVSLHFVYDF